MSAPHVHRRRRDTGTAACGAPAKQEHLTDDIEEVTCPFCWDTIRRRAAA